MDDPCCQDVEGRDALSFVAVVSFQRAFREQTDDPCELTNEQKLEGNVNFTTQLPTVLSSLHVSCLIDRFLDPCHVREGTTTRLPVLEILPMVAPLPKMSTTLTRRFALLTMFAGVRFTPHRKMKVIPNHPS